MYTINPHMPRIRRDAALFAERWGVRAAARHFGFSVGAVSTWKKKLERDGIRPIPTLSSRPRSHPRQLSETLVRSIITKRYELKRSAEVVHHALKEGGVVVSLSSVKRTLDRNNLIRKRSPWKRWHAPSPRPSADHPGALVQADTVHLAVHGKTVLYVYTLIDIHSRWAYAWCSQKANARMSLLFLKRAQVAAPFLFECIQTDNGSEWSTHFTERVQIRHRHSRVRRSNDNAHVERFNRTLREECLDALPVDLPTINRALSKYLHHYVEKRHHFGLGLRTPAQLLAQCSQAID